MRGGRLVKAPAFAARGGRRRRGLAGAREGAGGPSDGDLAALEQRSLAFLGRVVDGQEKDAEIRDRIAAARALAAHAVVARGRLPLPVAAARAPPCAWARLVSCGEWLPAKHLRWLGDKLMGVAKGEILRLAVSMPPGSGKSQVISRALPAWWLGVFPRDRVLVVSASSELTREWSRAARDDFAQWGEPVFGSTASATASASRWAVYDARTERRTGGSLVGVGIGGTIIGRRANVIICDDWIRSDVEANNAALREQHYRWFQSVALTRLLPGGRVILVSTRWHADDVLGRLEAQQARGEAAEPYVFVNLPAIAEQDDPLGRKPGEALWPEMWPASALDVKRREVGPHVWSSLFQGRPVPAEGGMFKRSWFGYFDHDALTGRVTVEGIGTSDTRDLVKFHTVGLAVSTKTTADYTVVATFTVHKAWGLAFVLDLRRVRVEGPDLDRKSTRLN